MRFTIKSNITGRNTKNTAIVIHVEMLFTVLAEYNIFERNNKTIASAVPAFA